MSAAREDPQLRVVTIGPLAATLPALVTLDAHVSAVPGGRGASLRRDARSASLALVSDPCSLAGAALAHRAVRVPWVAVLDEETAARLGGAPWTAALLGQAQAVVASASVRARLHANAPHARWVDAGQPARVADVLRDVAASPQSRSPEGGRAGRAAVGTWMFVEGRAERLAIRLVRLTGKAPEPVHPKHLVRDAAWHHWYDDAIADSSRLLDIGCNNGAHTLRLAPRLASAVGVDVDAAAVERAQRTAAGEGYDHLAFLRGDLTEEGTLDELADEPFDVALLLDVLEHIVEREQFLRRIHSVLRPGGKLLVAVPNVDTRYKRVRRRLGGAAYSDPDHKIEYTEPMLRAELAAGGFEIERLETGGYDTPFAGISTLIAPVSMRLYSALARSRARRARARVDDAAAFRVIACSSGA